VAESQHAGAAVMLKRLKEMGIVEITRGTEGFECSQW
jgi:hypothetical protein